MLAPLLERSKHCDEGRNSPDFQFLPSGKLLRLATLDKAHTPTLLGGTTKVGGQEEGLKQRGARNQRQETAKPTNAPRWDSWGHRDTEGEELTRGRNTSLVSGGRRGRQSRGVGLPKDSPLQDTDGLSFREEYR